MTATVAALATEAPRRGFRVNPLVAVIAALAVVLVVVTILTRSDSDQDTLSIHNPTPTGTRALAQIVGDRGVDVRQIDRLADARILDPASTTLVIVEGAPFYDYQAQSLLEYPGDVVWIMPSTYSYGLFEADLSSTRWFGAGGTAVADCAHPAALAGGEMTISDGVVNVPASSAATGCFEAGTGSYAYAVLEQGGRSVTFVESWAGLTNEYLAEVGNAAVAIHLVGAEETLLWYLGDGFDSTSLTWGAGDGTLPEFEAQPDFLPPGTSAVILALGLAVLVLALAQGRRFGRLVPEPLPVVVHGSEASRGRGRMYRAGRARGRAAAALRAASAARLAQRLRVPRRDGPDSLVAAIAHASRRPETEVRDLYYGPAPESDAALVRLSEALDTVETEILG